jgi:hypothetical protein
LIRENAAGVQARADTLAQMPRLGWAVATDENTMHDLTADELAFRPHPGEHIEITQLQKAGGEPRRLLSLPADSDVRLPVVPGTHAVARANHLHVVTVVSVEPRQRADEVVGALAVSKQIDTSRIEQRLAARGINAQLRTSQGSMTLAGSPPGTVEAKVALPGAGAELVASNVGRPRWPLLVSPLILMLSLAAAGLLWQRGAAPPWHVDNPFAAASPPAPAPLSAGHSASAPSHSTASAPSADTSAAEEWAASQVQATPAIGNPLMPLGAVPDPSEDHAFSGKVEIPLNRSGPVPFSSRPPRLPPPGGSAAAADPRTEEYRSLFAEFVKLRRTTGESVDGLDAPRFIEMLRDKRAQIMEQTPVKDVRFKLAFQNGKAAIRYVTVT